MLQSLKQLLNSQVYVYFRCVKENTKILEDLVKLRHEVSWVNNDLCLQNIPHSSYMYLQSDK